MYLHSYTFKTKGFRFPEAFFASAPFYFFPGCGINPIPIPYIFNSDEFIFSQSHSASGKLIKEIPDSSEVKERYFYSLAGKRIWLIS
ncbi:hypothetical protein AM233_14760 [Bacillus sp. FJAT-22058]|nr:hypothetical protein AM233_14760 [Bacillus sp. FJAT-22058]